MLGQGKNVEENLIEKLYNLPVSQSCEHRWKEERRGRPNSVMGSWEKGLNREKVQAGEC